GTWSGLYQDPATARIHPAEAVSPAHPACTPAAHGCGSVGFPKTPRLMADALLPPRGGSVGRVTDPEPLSQSQRSGACADQHRAEESVGPVAVGCKAQEVSR